MEGPKDDNNIIRRIPIPRGLVQLSQGLNSNSIVAAKDQEQSPKNNSTYMTNLNYDENISKRIPRVRGIIAQS